MARSNVALALLLLAGGSLLAVAQPRGASDAATLTLQFNNRQRTVLSPAKKQAILQALADSVFLVPVSQVQLVGSINQSGVLSRQSVVTFKAVGPATNKQPVLRNCQQNTRRGLIGSSRARKAIKKATDTWWPRDAVRVQKADCAPA